MSYSLHFFRDVSNRLTHDRSYIYAVPFPELCQKVADHFGLKPCSELIVGIDQLFWDFTDGASTVELAMDPWFGFTVTAKEPIAEQLVRNIAGFLSEALPPPRQQ